MKFSVGYRSDRAWIDEIVARRESLFEVYFAPAGMPSGRAVVDDADLLAEDLGRIADAGIPLHVLFNANCYGADSLSRVFLSDVGDVIARFDDGALSGVTTSSPVIAKFVKANFPALKVRASVNMEVGTVEAMEYVCDIFDAFCLKREMNRDLAAVGNVKEWCDAHGKELILLANSGCLNNCPAHFFHDNLVAHEREIAQKDNGYAFHGICREWLARNGNGGKWREHANFIEPEEVPRYEGLCTAMKLATRVNPHPIRILSSYISGSHLDDMAGLLEPSHAKGC